MVSLVLAAVIAAVSQTPLALVKDGNAALQKELNSKAVTVDKLANTVEGYVDFGELAKRALGKEWDKLSKPQQQDFTTTMKGLLRASYAQKAIGQGTAAVKYGKETVTENEAQVETTVAVKKEQVPVLYKLYRANPKASWRVYDLVTDDVSLLESYRDQFRQQISKKGFDGLLATLKAKREEYEKAPPPAPKPEGGAPTTAGSVK